MVNEKEIQLGSQKVTGYEIDLQGVPLVLVKGLKGFVMCGYLNVAAADKFGQVAAVVKGVQTIEDVLNGAVVEITQAARGYGIQTGMTGRQALEKMV